jgi:predicted unusual protein kinase regulating ubiquinone biosynthesis (AarF/ABC1/UbiB family)
MPRIPTSRLARTARFGGLVAGQSARWAGTQVANRVRTDEAAEAADAKRALGLADELVTRLGEMKGAAMKLGQVLSTVDFDMVPEGEREAFKERLAALRDQAPAVPLERMQRVISEDLGGDLAEHFAAFDTSPVAAASIGQVYRAR